MCRQVYVYNIREEETIMWTFLRMFVVSLLRENLYCSPKLCRSFYINSDNLAGCNWESGITIFVITTNDTVVDGTHSQGFILASPPHSDIVMRLRGAVGRVSMWNTHPRSCISTFQQPHISLSTSTVVVLILSGCPGNGQHCYRDTEWLCPFNNFYHFFLHKIPNIKQKCIHFEKILHLFIIHTFIL